MPSISLQLLHVPPWVTVLTPVVDVGTGPFMLKSEDVQEFRTALLMLQARIKGDVEQLEEDAFSAAEGGDHGSTNHMAEMGTDAWEIDVSMRFVESDQEVLSEIADALNRIEAGVFGLCESCVESGVVGRKACIPKSRLKAIPYARNCISCERKREQESSLG